MNIMIDMDGVICTEEKTFERALARPIPGAREALQLLKDGGHQIIIYSARSWSELAMTKKWLADNDIAYDGLHLGKPVADRIIDDRAIHFNGWPAAMESLSKGNKPDVDEIYLRQLRLATVDFLDACCRRPELFGPVLEVGPMTRHGLNSPVYSRMPEAFYDSRATVTGRGIKYVSVDMDSNTSPDICCDFVEIEQHIGAGSVGAVIMASCLEHMPQVFAVPDILHRILAPRGMVFLLTPWNLRFHGPRPDCWRISDDGYRALFQSMFNIVSLEKIPCGGRPLSPIGMQCILHRRDDV